MYTQESEQLCNFFFDCTMSIRKKAQTYSRYLKEYYRSNPLKMIFRVYMSEKVVLLARIGFISILYEFIGNACRGINDDSLCVYVCVISLLMNRTVLYRVVYIYFVERVHRNIYRYVSSIYWMRNVSMDVSQIRIRNNFW